MTKYYFFFVLYFSSSLLNIASTPKKFFDLINEVNQDFKKIDISSLFDNLIEEKKLKVHAQLQSDKLSIKQKKVLKSKLKDLESPQIRKKMIADLFRMKTKDLVNREKNRLENINLSNEQQKILTQAKDLITKVHLYKEEEVNSLKYAKWVTEYRKLLIEYNWLQ